MGSEVARCEFKSHPLSLLAYINLSQTFLSLKQTARFYLLSQMWIVIRLVKRISTLGIPHPEITEEIERTVQDYY